MPSNIVVPEVGESIVDARVAKWLRKEGDAVAAGDPLVELETDKIDLEVAAPQAGVLKRIDRKDGEDVKVGEVLGVIEDDAAGRDDDRDRGSNAASSRKAAAGAESRRPAEKTALDTDRAQGGRSTTRSISARVRGSGDAGRVMRRDVEQAARGAATSDAAASATPADAGRDAKARARAARCRSSAPRAGRAHRRARPHVEAARDDRPAAGRGAEHRRDAHDLQRGRHDGGDGAARAAQAGVQGAPRRRPRHRRRSSSRRRSARCARSRASTRRSRATRWCSSTTTTSASPSARAEGLVVPVLRDADRMSFAEIEQQIREFAKRPRTARCRSRISRAGRSRSPTAACSARC